jgi:hypothetical protein
MRLFVGGRRSSGFAGGAWGGEVRAGALIKVSQEEFFLGREKRTVG